MSDAWEEAAKEAFASAPAGVVVLNTLHLSHPALADGDIFIVQDFQGHVFTLENGGGDVYFEPAPFRFTLPATGQNGIQELSIAIDNIDQRVSDFIDSIGSNPEPAVVKYRAYLSTNKTAPQNGVPLTLFLSDVTVSPIEVVGRASFADIINRSFLSQLYTTTRFPGLA